MKRELAELRKKIITSNQDINPSNNTYQNIDTRAPKDSAEKNNHNNDISTDRLKKICTNNSKIKEICMLIDINLPLNTKRNKKVVSQYNPISTSLYTKPKQKSKKQMSSVLKDIYTINNPSKKSSFGYNAVKPIKPIQHEQKRKCAKGYYDYLTNHYFFYNDKKQEPKQQTQQFIMGRSYPMNTWFIRQNEKYKDVFYKETSSNIRNLVSYTENKEIKVPFNKVKASNSSIIKSKNTNLLFAKRQDYDNLSRDKFYLYQSELDDFSNKLFKKEVPTLQNKNNDSKYYLPTYHNTITTTTGNYSSRKDSLITNYQKILQKKVPIKKL